MENPTPESAAQFVKLLNDYGELDISVEMPLVYWLQAMDFVLQVDNDLGDSLAAAVAEGVNEHFGNDLDTFDDITRLGRNGCGNFNLLTGDATDED